MLHMEATAGRVSGTVPGTDRPQWPDGGRYPYLLQVCCWVAMTHPLLPIPGIAAGLNNDDLNRLRGTITAKQLLAKVARRHVTLDK